MQNINQVTRHLCNLVTLYFWVSKLFLPTFEYVGILPQKNKHQKVHWVQRVDRKEKLPLILGSNSIGQWQKTSVGWVTQGIKLPRVGRDYILLLSHCKDPCKPISIMECDTVLIAAQLISVVNGICFIRVPFSSIGLELDGCFLLNKIGVYQPTGWIGRGIYLFPFGLCTSVDVQKPLKTQ